MKRREFITLLGGAAAGWRHARSGSSRRLRGYTARADGRSSHIPDASSTEESQPLTQVSRRHVVAGAVTLVAAGTISPAFAQSTDGSPNMPENIRFSNPDTMQKPPGYSHVVEVMGPGRTVYFAGQLGIDKSGKMGANAREQMEIAFENVKAALTSVGAGFEHVVKLNNYIIDIGTNIAHYREVRDKYVNTAAPPASTTIGVPQLARPGALFEVEAVAVLPPKWVNYACAFNLKTAAAIDLDIPPSLLLRADKIIE
jgi:enamine deaminase RidA (YjgF/YER057c/UK114 family)